MEFEKSHNPIISKTLFTIGFILSFFIFTGMFTLIIGLINDILNFNTFKIIAYITAIIIIIGTILRRWL